MQAIDHYDDQGRPCDRFGNLIHGHHDLVADGEAVTVGIVFMDSVQRQVHDQAADPYDVWLHGGQAALTDHVATHDDDDDAYERWLHGTSDATHTVKDSDAYAAWQRSEVAA